MRSGKGGFVAAVVAAVAYGLNPLFALPLYEEGLLVDSVLFYRQLFALVILGLIMAFRRKSLFVRRSQVAPIMLLGGLFAATSFTLFDSFNYLDAGVACTILFVYPVMVAVMMALFFGERASLLTYLCIALSLLGIVLLYQGDGQPLDIVGVTLALISALTYALYVVVINKSSAGSVDPFKLTFWVVLFAVLIFAVKIHFFGDFQPINTPSIALNISGLSLVTTVLTMVLIAYAVTAIGSTKASIVGCLEPLTALVIGVMVFGEVVTPRMIVGVVLILISVAVIILRAKR